MFIDKINKTMQILTRRIVPLLRHTGVLKTPIREFNVHVFATGAMMIVFSDSKKDEDMINFGYYLMFIGAILPN